MTTQIEPRPQDEMTNGPAAASILAAAAGCFLMGVFYVLGNASTVCNRLFSIYKPAGALSGVSAATIILWLALWAILDRKWAAQDVPMRRIGLWSSLLLLGGLLLTFPPVARLF